MASLELVDVAVRALCLLQNEVLRPHMLNKGLLNSKGLHGLEIQGPGFRAITRRELLNDLVHPNPLTARRRTCVAHLSNKASPDLRALAHGLGRPATRLAHQYPLHFALEELLLLDPLVLAVAPTNGRDLRSRPNQL